ncbi:hypothetical protein [Mesorhizobium sp. B1-1-5]|uniref:hypothetical protein n=1 Tax=Mesorhizobium sp. B1-1-5 TaxID=2589979 RepID=UPI0032B2B1B7
MSRHQFVQELEKRVTGRFAGDAPPCGAPAAEGWRAEPGARILAGLAAEMGKGNLDLVETILDDWLVANAYLPVPHALDEESATKGST